MRALRLRAAFCRSLATWTASSRVGTITRACGAPGTGSLSKPASSGPTTRCSAGMPKPRVLPVPVLAWPMMSWPLRATGRVMAWIGKGWVMPASARDSTMSARTLKSAKVFSAISCGFSSEMMVSSGSIVSVPDSSVRSWCVCNSLTGEFPYSFWAALLAQRGRPGGRSGARSGAQANPVEADRGLSKCWHWGPAGLSQDRVGAGLLNSKIKEINDRASISTLPV